MPKSQEYCHGRRRRSIIDLFYLCCQKILQKKLTTSILRPSLRNSLEIGRLPREVNNKNTYRQQELELRRTAAVGLLLDGILGDGGGQHWRESSSQFTYYYIYHI